jgi:hypothetical protein
VVDSKLKGAGKGLVAFDPDHKGEKDHVVFSTQKKNLPSHPTRGLITPYQISGEFLSKDEVKGSSTKLMPYALSVKGDPKSLDTY